ncbi:MAG: hypothetical protein QXU83_07340 [Candidatus Bathyarchaeia archaeon]
MSKEAIADFMKAIKDPAMFLKYCKKYHEEDPRDIAYIIIRNIIFKDPENLSYILAASKLIITWNTARHQRLPYEIRKSLEDDIIKAYEESRRTLESFKNERLELLVLEDDLTKEKIKTAFFNFSSKKSIGSTGASKILHIINPHVFMMWDTNIRNSYHKLHKKNHKTGDEECYFEFLKQCQEIVRAILKQKSEEDLWKIHHNFLDKDFIEALSFKENILKMLDECNFVRFKLNIEL